MKELNIDNLLEYYKSFLEDVIEDNTEISRIDILRNIIEDLELIKKVEKR